MLIYVDLPSGRTTGVSLRPSDTVGDLKVRIEEEEWIPKDRQRLTYRNNKLEDGQTFESYGIGEGATIHLSRPDYAERDEAYYIYIQRTEEDVFRVRIKASDTIGSLKTRLWNGGGLTTSGQQPLVFNEQQLEDGKKFYYYNIQEGAIIRFPCKMDKVFPISIQLMAMHRIRLEVTGSEIIGNLKSRLPASRREHLIFDGMRLETGRTLSDYNIQEEATIYLPGQIGAAIPIHIRLPTGETIRISIDGFDAIGRLKSRLHAWVPRDMQQLIFDGQQLEDEKLFFDYNIQKESTLDLQLPLHAPLGPLPNWITESMNITVITLTQKKFLIRVKGTDTIDFVKSRIENQEDYVHDQQRLIFGGKQLKDERALSEYGILKDATLHFALRLRGGGPGDVKESLGLVDIAQAISLWNWDGIMPGPARNNTLTTGLRLAKGEAVTVGRIVNDEWYQGFNKKDICGYFPRAFVSVRKVDSTEFKDDIHVDDTPIEKLQVDDINGPSVKARPIPSLTSFQRVIGIFSMLFPSTPPPVDWDRPDLPPSPLPAPPAFDRIVDGNRVLLQFSLDPKDKQRNYILRATLSLNSGPGARFSDLTFNVSLVDGTILEISPENVAGPETEAGVTKDKNHKVSLNASLKAGSAGSPLSGSIGRSSSFTSAEHITFIRKTRGTVQGNGVGSSRAYWVMKEDNGPAAEQGLGPVFDLMVKLNVRPAIVPFEVVAYIICESGERKTIRSGILNTSV